MGITAKRSYSSRESNPYWGVTGKKEAFVCEITLKLRELVKGSFSRVARLWRH